MVNLFFEVLFQDGIDGPMTTFDGWPLLSVDVMCHQRSFAIVVIVAEQVMVFLQQFHSRFPIFFFLEKWRFIQFELVHIPLFVFTADVYLRFILLHVTVGGILLEFTILESCWNFNGLFCRIDH